MPALLQFLLPLLGFTGGSAGASALLKLLARSGMGQASKLAAAPLAQHAASIGGGFAGQIGLEHLLNPQNSVPTNDTELSALASRPDIRQNQLMELLLTDQARSKGLLLE